MKLAVIVPVRGHPESLALSLAALAGSCRSEDERIVVDDGMDGRARKIAMDLGFQVVRGEKPGVAAARNTGARTAAGDVLLFVDSDVLLTRSGVERIRGAFCDSTVHGVVAALGAGCPIPNFASRFKNLWMRHTYLARLDGVSLFYTCAAAVRRDCFGSVGGFDERYEEPSIEDTEIGFRLGRAGARIVVLTDVHPVHLKRYSIGSLLRTDFRRSVALTRHVLRSRRGGQLSRAGASSVPVAFQASVAVTIPLCAIAFASIGAGRADLAASIVAAWLALLAVLYRGFLGFLFRSRGAAFAARSALFLPIETIVASAGVVWGVAGYLSGKRY